jgi:hypothetical protein
MRLEGGCYCKGVRYVAEGEPLMKAECHCRECQYITGGSPSLVMAMPAAGFSYTKDAPAEFTRSDLERPVTREFCPTCGTHLTSRMKGGPIVAIKVGTLDDPRQFGGPAMAIFMVDNQPYHWAPEGIPTYERMPPR